MRGDVKCALALLETSPFSKMMGATVFTRRPIRAREMINLSPNVLSPRHGLDRHPTEDYTFKFNQTFSSFTLGLAGLMNHSRRPHAVQLHVDWNASVDIGTAPWLTNGFQGVYSLEPVRAGQELLGTYGGMEETKEWFEFRNIHPVEMRNEVDSAPALQNVVRYALPGYCNDLVIRGLRVYAGKDFVEGQVVQIARSLQAGGYWPAMEDAPIGALIWRQPGDRAHLILVSTGALIRPAGFLEDGSAEPGEYANIDISWYNLEVPAKHPSRFAQVKCGETAWIQLTANRDIRKGEELLVRLDVLPPVKPGGVIRKFLDDNMAKECFV